MSTPKYAVKRSIVQIAVGREGELYALANDGTLWLRWETDSAEGWAEIDGLPAREVDALPPPQMGSWPGG